MLHFLRKYPRKSNLHRTEILYRFMVALGDRALPRLIFSRDDFIFSKMDKIQTLADKNTDDLRTHLSTLLEPKDAHVKILLFEMSELHRRLYDYEIFVKAAGTRLVLSAVEDLNLDTQIYIQIIENAIVEDEIAVLHIKRLG